MQSLSLREERGRSIARLEGQIRRIDDNSYEVKSQSGHGAYSIVATEFGWACSCPDNQWRGLDCKHILGVRFSLSLRRRVERSVVIQPVNVSACPKCRSDSIKKHGIRHNDSGDIQKFQCKSCGHWFTINLGFEKMKATPQTVTMAMQMYFSRPVVRLCLSCHEAEGGQDFERGRLSSGSRSTWA